MGKLTLGELDVAYATPTGEAGSLKVTLTTTGAVAEILEERYGVMQTFYDRRKEKIAEYLGDSVADAIADALAGRKTRTSPTYGAEQKIEAEFRAFLDANEMNTISKLMTGAPISKAADRGVSHRKKRPNAGVNPSRPAFIDTGLYRQSFRAEVKIDKPR